MRCCFFVLGSLAGHACPAAREISHPSCTSFCSGAFCGWLISMGKQWCVLDSKAWAAWGLVGVHGGFASLPVDTEAVPVFRLLWFLWDFALDVGSVFLFLCLWACPCMGASFPTVLLSAPLWSCCLISCYLQQRFVRSWGFSLRRFVVQGLLLWELLLLSKFDVTFCSLGWKMQISCFSI